MSEINPDPPASADPAPSSPSVQDVNVVHTLSDGTLVKRRLPRMRACNQRDEKGKMCAGHLKRWFRYGPEVAGLLGSSQEIYRCERCHTLYLPHPEDPHTGMLSY